MKRPPETLRIAGPAGALDARLHPAEEPAGVAAVVCHPHPQHGGTMDNKVVTTTVRALNLMGVDALRFDYRGVRASEGSYDDGMGETDDALAAVAMLRGRGAQRIWLAGFSFGAGVSLRAAGPAGAEQLVSIAPPVERLPLAELEVPACPWLILTGDEDELVEVAAVIAWVDALPPGPELVVLPGASHFFHGRLTELRDQLVASLEPRL